jgi:hypothetical protein
MWLNFCCNLNKSHNLRLNFDHNLNKGHNQKDPYLVCNQISILTIWTGVTTKRTQVYLVIKFWLQFGQGLQPRKCKSNWQFHFNRNLDKGRSQKDLGLNYDQILITRLIGAKPKGLKFSLWSNFCQTSRIRAT